MALAVIKWKQSKSKISLHSIFFFFIWHRKGGGPVSLLHFLVINKDSSNYTDSEQESLMLVFLWGWIECYRDPNGNSSLFPVSSCYISFRGLPPARRDKAGPFIPVPLHKSSHQLKAHYWSPDPSITEGRGDWWTTRLSLCFLLQQKKQNDWFPLFGNNLMSIEHQSIKYSLLWEGPVMSWRRIGFWGEEDRYFLD